MSWNDHDCSQEQENFCSICENELREKLATANAKIVELEKKCKNLDGIIGSLDVKDPNACDALLNVQLINQNTIKGLKAELSTANTKAEKLVEALEKIDNIPNGVEIVPNWYIVRKIAEQALKEFRGEK